MNKKFTHKVIQMVPALYKNDAVGNEVLAISRLLDEQGIENYIVAESVDEKLLEEQENHVDEKNLKNNKKICKIRRRFFNMFRIYIQSGILEDIQSEDVVIYHMASGSGLSKIFSLLKGKKIMRYHNVTPPEMLAPYNKNAARNCKKGIKDMKLLAGKVDKCIAVSSFNRQGLIDAGCTCQIDVVPIILDMDKYRTDDRKEVLPAKACSKKGAQIIFVGRIAPNKKYEDILEAFHVYNRDYDSCSTLLLVGGDGGYENYSRELKALAERLGISERVIFTGKADSAKILAYYETSDVFLCMSEHEGFCVPIIEAFLLDVPVVAYESCAIPETMGGGGVLVPVKDYNAIAREMNMLVTQASYREAVLDSQRKRLKELDKDIIKKRMLLSIFQ